VAVELIDEVEATAAELDRDSVAVDSALDEDRGSGVA